MEYLKKWTPQVKGGGSQEGDNSVGQELLMLLKNKTTCIKIYKTDIAYYNIPGLLLFGRGNLGHNLLHSDSKFCFSGNIIWKRNLIPLLHPYSLMVECPLHLCQEIPLFSPMFLFLFYLKNCWWFFWKYCAFLW